MHDLTQRTSSAESVVSLEFEQMLAGSICGRLKRRQTTTVQINTGRFCNQCCQHCHVNSTSQPTREVMTAAAAERILTVLAASPAVETVDITGGAPELNANFRTIVAGARALGCAVIDRCNLTALLEPGMQQMPEFLARNGVEIVASLPCYTAANVDQQRGPGIFDKSIRALQWLNSFGYGCPGSALTLNLVHNPLGAWLPPPQEQLESEYRRHLSEHYGIEFHRLLTLTNMPIGRFASALNRTGKFESYFGLLVQHYNPATVQHLMCRSLINVGWDGKLSDCDFNQALGLCVGSGAASIWQVASFNELDGTEIVTGRHCFGCTAGSGSSCQGTLQWNGKEHTDDRVTVCVFLKPPRPGEVKTRLSPALGLSGAAEFAHSSFQDTWQTVCSVKWARPVVACTEPVRFSDHRPVWLQGNGDLGRRMETVIRRACRRSHKVIVVGSDSPGMPRRLLESARAALAHSDAVLGPSEDGGFYLIGLNSCPAGLLSRIYWSRLDTFAQTICRLQEAGMSVSVLEPWFDVDTPEDLRRLQSLVESGTILAPHTAAVFQRWNLRRRNDTANQNRPPSQSF